MRSVPEFDHVLRRERQFNLLRIIHELPGAKRMPWWTVCRVAGLTEIEIRLLNDVLAEEARGPVQVA
jgi:hypothetical protein